MKQRAPKPIAPEKLNALLLKLRKGADACLSLHQLFQVLDRIGGFVVRPCVGVVESSNDGLVAEEDQAAARATYDQIKLGEVVAWPAEPTAGVTYYADVEAFGSWDRRGTTIYGAHYREARAHNGYEVEAATGATERFLPHWYGSKPEVYVVDVLRWLKAETDYFVRVSAVLGMEPHIPAAERTTDNTGSCPVCFGNFKLVHLSPSKSGPPSIVLHGYRRPRIGYVVGECEGRGKTPFELSAEDTRAHRAAVTAMQDRTATSLAAMRSGTLASLTDARGNTYTPEHPEWSRRLAAAIASTESMLKGLEAEVKLLTWLIDHWEARPLPKAGERIRNWRIEAWTAMRKAAAVESSKVAEAV